MNLVDRLGYLQFDEDDVFDELVNSIFPDHDPIASNDHGVLLRDGEPRLAQLVHQCVFIHFLKKPSSQCVEHRQGAANDCLDRRLILSPPVSICVFCVFCGSIFLVYCRHNLANSLTPAVQQRRGWPAHRVKPGGTLRRP